MGGRLLTGREAATPPRRLPRRQLGGHDRAQKPLALNLGHLHVAVRVAVEQQLLLDVGGQQLEDSARLRREAGTDHVLRGALLLAEDLIDLGDQLADLREAEASAERAAEVRAHAWKQQGGSARGEGGGGPLG